MKELVCEGCGRSVTPYHVCLRDPVSKIEYSFSFDSLKRGWPDTPYDEEASTEEPVFCFDCLCDALLNPYSMGEDEVRKDES